MYEMKIQILRVTDYSIYPGWVDCQVIDAWGTKHIFNEKIPIVTYDDIDIYSIFPQDGCIRCEVLKEWFDEQGRKIITISTEKPDCVEAVSEVNTFDLLDNQVRYIGQDKIYKE